jgi:hypothetical protein
LINRAFLAFFLIAHWQRRLCRWQQCEQTGADAAKRDCDDKWKQNLGEVCWLGIHLISKTFE